MSKKVIVTGATGQDGSYMIEYLLNNTDYEVIGGVRRTSQTIDSNLKNVLNHPRFKIIHFDLNDAHSITSTIKNEQPDFFVNFGAQTFVADSWKMPLNHLEINTLGVLHILEAAKNFAPHCRVYSSGSSEQWGDVDYSPQDINHPMKPRSPYGVSKCASSLLCKVYRESYDLFVVHGILTNHESERRQEYFVTRKITKGVSKIHHEIRDLDRWKNRRANNEPLMVTPIELGNMDAKRDWSHAQDFVEGIWLMLNQDKPKDYVLSSGETHSIREFVELAFNHAGIHGNWQGEGVGETYGYDDKGKRIILVKINPDFFRPAEVSLLLGDSTPIREELSWKPKVSFDNLVEKMVKFDIDAESSTG